MRRLYLLLLLTFAFCSLRVYSTNIRFLNTIPENGSEITTFDIKLKFDISEAINESGNENIRIGYTGNKRTNNTKIYDGTAEEGTLLTTVLTKSVMGVEYSNDYIDLEIPSSFVPQPGHTYTVVFANQVAMFDANGASVANSVISYNKEPITFTFYGGKASSEELLFQNASVANNENVESLNSIIFEFNEEIEIFQNKSIEIYNGDEMIASSNSIEIDHRNSSALKVSFETVPLYLGNLYTIKLPEGLVSLKKNSTVINKPVEIKVNGASTVRLSTKSVSIENGSVVLPNNVRIEFNLEDKQTLTAPTGVIHKRDIGFYKGEISDENLIETLRGTASGDGITWDLSTYQFEPEERYSLCLKPDGITVWLNGKSQPAYGNEEVIITFTTPSVKDAGFSPIEFGPTVISAASSDNEATYEDNLKRAYLSNMIVSLKDKYYYYGDQKCSIHVSPDFEYKRVCNLYEITSEGDRLIKSYSFASLLQEDARSLWMTQVVSFNTPLYEGKTYKFVVPEGYFTAYPDIYIQGVNTNDLSKVNFIRSEELVYTFEGTTPTNVVLLECNVPDNSVSSSIGKVVWIFDGLYRIGENIKTIEVSVDLGKDIKPMISQKIPSIATDLGKTFVTLDFISNTTGLPTSIPEGVTYTLTIPSGLLVNSVNDEMTNDEIILTIKGGKETSSAPEFVNVNLSINGMHTASHPAIKGKPYTLKLDPGTDWKVESVMNGDKVLTEQALAKSTYVFTPTADSNINATLAYDGKLATEITTDVWEITDKNISIYRDNNHIVVDGVTPSNTINIYSVSGIRITSIHVTDGNDRVNITVPSGQIYIVSVDGVAAKISMKN